MNHVEDLLRKTASCPPKLIVTDGVFSMDGDIAPLPDLVRLAEQYGAMLMVDDAHATGVLGRGGRDDQHFSLEGRVQIQMGTLGKALDPLAPTPRQPCPSSTYLINKSRTFIFSTALPPVFVLHRSLRLTLWNRNPALRTNLGE